MPRFIFFKKRNESCFNVPVFMGSLSEMPLYEVLRLLIHSSQTGVLHLLGKEDNAPLAGFHIQTGQMVEATLGADTGLDALKECCKISNAQFAFEEGASLNSSSLLAYDTGSLLQELEEQTVEYANFKASLPDLSDRPVYQRNKVSDELEVSADDLSLLLLCDGSRQVMEICVETGLSSQKVQQVLAQLLRAGLIRIEEPQEEKEAPSPSPPEHNTPSQSTGKFWRGRRIN